MNCNIIKLNVFYRCFFVFVFGNVDILWIIFVLYGVGIWLILKMWMFDSVE